MYITKIELENIRCFKTLNISFEKHGQPYIWNMILGDNSSGKTCLLRCLAIGLCDEISGAALMKELSGDFLRENKLPGEIKITLKDHKDKYNISTKITLENGREKIIQTIKGNKEKLRQKLFVCGYGIQRSGKGSESHEYYSILEAVYTLFNYYTSLSNPEVILLRQPKDIQGAILKMLMNILMLDEQGCSFEMTKRGVEIVRNDQRVPLGSWGDGYVSTSNWVLDFLGWQIYADRLNIVKDLKDLKGIVLLDEIELNLHPSWQKSIIQLLREQFPKVQFIMTSHAPLCAIGATCLKDEECQLILLTKTHDNVEATCRPPLRGRRADQVLTSYLFGLDTTSDDETRNEIEQYSNLLSKENILENDKKAIEKLSKALDNKLSTEETELETHVAKAIHEVLKKMPDTKHFKEQVIDYEIKNQLRRLLGHNK